MTFQRPRIPRMDERGGLARSLAMKQVLLTTALIAAPAVSQAAPFRPFVDLIGVTPTGAIVTTTNASGQDDAQTPHPSRVIVFAADGTRLAAIDGALAVEGGHAFTPAQWRATTAWVQSWRAHRVATRPLAELRCESHPTPGDVACPTSTADLVRTPTGLARWNPDGANPAWAWGEPAVAELGATCVLLMPNNAGTLDRTDATAVSCPK